MKKHWLKRMTMLSALLILGLIFIAYLRPEFALDLANRFILCF